MPSEWSLKRTGAESVVLPVLLIIFGFAITALPIVTSIGVALGIGLWLSIAALVQLVHAFQFRGVGPVAWQVLIGICYLIAGMYLVTHPVIGVAGLSLAVAVFFFCESFLDIVAYFSTGPAIASGWILVDGIIALALALMIWSRWPASSWWVVGTLVGVGVIVGGISRLMMALALRRLRRSHTERAFPEKRAA